jgi:CheY-like chemotaxis protein
MQCTLMLAPGSDCDILPVLFIDWTIGAELDTNEQAIGGQPPVIRKKRSNSKRSVSKHPLPIRSSIAMLATILVVEPEVLARMAIADYLRTCGYKVIEANTIEDAFKVLQSEAKVDLVFAEVSHLGASEGFALAKQIRESYPHIDVILTSNVVQAADKAGDLCDQGVLKKPYHPDELVRRIQILREQRRSSKLI